MMLSHTALSCLNMNQYAKVWTHFKQSSIIFLQNIFSSWSSILDLDQVLSQVQALNQILDQVVLEPVFRAI